MCSNDLRLWSLIVLLLGPTVSVRRQILSHDFISSINKRNTTWIAGQNFPEDIPLEYLRKIGSGALISSKPVQTLPRQDINYDDIPEFFDARLKWPFCESLSEIRYQGYCAACWAFSPAGVMTDRLCIQTNGTLKFKFSPEELLSCCRSCGDCSGGDPWEAWTYWIREGLVSGGDADSHQGCLPYSSDALNDGITPECVKSCESDYPISYEDDKHFGAEIHYGVATDLKQIQYEIMTYGPVTATHFVYEDYYDYKSGVYQHVTGDYVGSHVIKILGWGVEDGTPYWLIATSWGVDWGDHGYNKILRGSNHLGIESNVYMGTPKIE